MNKIKRLVVIFTLILVTTLNLNAAYSLVIRGIDGKDEVFLLKKRPVLNFVGPDLNIIYESNLISIARSEIKNIDFKETQDRLIDIMSDIIQIEVIDNNTIRFSNVTMADISIFDINGYNINSAKIVSDGSYTTINLTTCKKGIYIIQYKDKSLKFVKK